MPAQTREDLRYCNIALYSAEADLIDAFRREAVEAWESGAVPAGSAGAADEEEWLETARKVVGSDKSAGYLALRAIQNVFHAVSGIVKEESFAELLRFHNEDVARYRETIETGRKERDALLFMNTAYYYENSADLEERACFNDAAIKAAAADFTRFGRPALSEKTIKKLLFRESISHNQVELALKFLHFAGYLEKRKGGRGNAMVYISPGRIEEMLNAYLCGIRDMFNPKGDTI